MNAAPDRRKLEAVGEKTEFSLDNGGKRDKIRTL